MIEQKFLLKDGRAAILRTPSDGGAAEFGYFHVFLSFFPNG